ncbi:MAG: methyltransferase [Amylibacter sp.]
MDHDEFNIVCHIEIGEKKYVKQSAPEDDFLNNFLGAVALDAAFRFGVIDCVSSGAALTENKSTNILVGMLQEHGVLIGPEFSPKFQRVLSDRRPILEQKLSFLIKAAADIVSEFDTLLFDLPAFMKRSNTFALFQYDQAMNTGPTAIYETRKWVKYLSALTTSEAPYLVEELPFAGVDSVLEVGGNAGAFAHAYLAKFSSLTATIMDLPAVCAIGEETPHARLSFMVGDVRKPDWTAFVPEPVDAVLFKSVLHDWPDDHVDRLLLAARARLKESGRIVICERGPYEATNLKFSNVANLVFAPFYRTPDIYRRALKSLGCSKFEETTVDLDMTFNIVTGYFE